MPLAVATMAEHDESWSKCAVCLDTLYRPCVNSVCGHLQCLWCMHKVRKSEV